jgi:2-polyprenyl-3-methyl-5-hydroxy-6-metoxy-1,4-benzoquinol methylase
MINGNREYVNCNLCNSDDTKLLFVKRGFNIVQCRKCGLVYVNPRLKAETLKKFQTKGYYLGNETPEYESPWGYADYIGMEKQLKRGFRKKLKIIEKYIMGGKLLDIGCAVGFFLEVAEENNWECFGVEISEWASNYARERGLNVFTGDLLEIKFPDEYFDVVTLWGVVENLRDLHSSLIEVNRILKKKGLVAISGGNIKSIVARFYGVNWQSLVPEGDLFYFSPDTLRKMLEATGFKIVKKVVHGNVTQNERIRRLRVYRHIRFVARKLGVGDTMAVYALKI